MSVAPIQIFIKNVNSMRIDFVHSFRPIYYFSRVFGLMPYTITYSSHGSIIGCEVKMFNALWFIASLTINLTLALMISKDTLYLRNPQIASNILSGGDYFLEIYGTIFNVVLIVMDMCMRSKFVNILQKINVFDEEVGPFF